MSYFNVENWSSIRYKITHRVIIYLNITFGAHGDVQFRDVDFDRLSHLPKGSYISLANISTFKMFSTCMLSKIYYLSPFIIDNSNYPVSCLVLNISIRMCFFVLEYFTSTREPFQHETIWVLHLQVMRNQLLTCNL